MNDFSSRKWVLVAGARPNFMKVAPILRAITSYNQTHGAQIHPILVHTGQHYDANMSDLFFKDLNLPEPDIFLEAGSGSHGEQTGKILIEFEKVLLREKPSLVIVVGDVNSTIACALAAVKLHIPVAHVESGLRSFDRRMPEEINRVLTDAISDFLFTPSPDADENLMKEGISPEKIFLVGDIMVDSLLQNLEQSQKSNILRRLGLLATTDPVLSSGFKQDGLEGSFSGSPVTSYALLTLHRPSNVDDRNTFSRIMKSLLEHTAKLPILFPLHPRTRKQIKELNMEAHFEFHPSPDLDPQDYHNGTKLKNKIHCFDPFGYLDFLQTMANAKLLLTDSGGIQEETTVLNIPCITLRDTTERPITITHGTNALVGSNPHKIAAEIDRVLRGETRIARCPLYRHGRTAEKIVEILASKCQIYTS